MLTPKSTMKLKLTKLTEYLFYLFDFLLPWQTRWIIQSGTIRGDFWEYGSFSLYGTDILLLVILILYLFSGAKNKIQKNLKRLWPFILAFLLVNLISVLLAIDKGIAVYGFIKILEAVILFFLVVNLRISLRKTSVVLVMTATLQVIFSLWQFFSQQVLAFKWLGLAAQLPANPGVYVIENVLGRFLRAYGSLHPIILSYFLVICLIIIFSLYWLARNTKQRWFVFAGLYLIVLGLILTFGRVAWLSALLGLLFFWSMVWWQLTKVGRRRLFWITSAVLLGALVFAFIFQDLVTTRLAMSDRLERVSIDERAFYLQDAVNLTKENWYQGVGVYNFTQAVRQDISATREAWNYQPPNNLYILILVETSIFGLIIFLGLLTEVFRQIFSRLKKLNLKKDFWFVIYTICFLLLLITAFFDHTYWTLQFGLLFFWLIFGLWARSLEA